MSKAEESKYNIGMTIKNDVNLANYSTMGLGGKAKFFAEIYNKQELEEAIKWGQEKNLPIIMIGGGSNIIWKDEGFEGLLLTNKIKKFEINNETTESTFITIGSGEVWDDVVERSVNLGLSGIEALSLIPGLAGATPIQNVGAYGQEISQTLTTLEAYDINQNKFVIIPAYDCNFSYRSSRFKTTDKHRFFITSVTLNLNKTNPSPPFYASLQNYLDNHDIHTYSPKIIRDAVIEIRNAKLPDPAVVKNVGSFFHNPIISETDYLDLASEYTMLPNWQVEKGKYKISAAWLIENVGMKDYHDEATGVATWPTQPLVFINENVKSTSDLLAFKDKVAQKVKEKFNISLNQEPELLP